MLVSCTDGVGTKLKLAFMTGRHDTVGIDLVAMNVNDLVVSGAEPLFFLDYFASGQLEVGVAEQVIVGHRRRLPGRPAARCSAARPPSCPASTPTASTTWPGSASASSRRAGASTARTIAPGDKLLGLASSGFHSNGYSLVRRVFLEARRGLRARLPGLEPALGEPLGERAAAPTRIYVSALRKLAAADLLQGAAHITGGGLVDNPPRMLPPGARPEAAARSARAGRCRRCFACWRAAAASPTTRCAAPSTWASA